MSRQVVVIPDLHGRADLLQAATEQFPQAHFLSLGDAIDRGPQSMETVRHLLRLRDEGRATLLMGNHERIAQEGPYWYGQYTGTHDLGEYRRAMEGYQSWMRAGGETVRRELGGLTLEQFPPLLTEYLGNLKRVVYVTADGQIHDEAPAEPSVLVAHAAPPVKHQQYPDPMSAVLWLRPFEGPFPLPGGVTYSLHGHTPVRTPTRLGRHVYVDLGAYDTGRLALTEIGDPSSPPSITVLCGSGRPELAQKYVKFGEPLPVMPVELPRQVSQ
ncbi:metallophosphoesterase [Deinococcus sp.]|uniref:metallophosphoesterase n=1 Tax=Deinococcus sp. TaxID=47478 RepID=UPI0025C2A70C|nr:metallophosphoesterase [Deinococcus sp.]